MWSKDDREKSSRSLGKPPRSPSSLAIPLPLPEDEGSPRSLKSPRDPQSRGHRSHRDKPKGGSAIVLTNSRSVRVNSERRRPEEKKTERQKRLSNSFDPSYMRDRGYDYDSSDKRRKDREDDGDRRERREYKGREGDRRERRERKERKERNERKERSKAKERRDRKEDDSMSASSSGSDIWLKPPSGHETELGPRSISSPALFCPQPQNEGDRVVLDPHQIAGKLLALHALLIPSLDPYLPSLMRAESILKGNLADLWEKYLLTLQPSRRVSTDRKIVSILKEKLKWLDSEDTLEKLLEQDIEEGTETSTSTSTARSETRILSDARSKVPVLGPVVHTTSPRISSPLSSRARLPVMIPVIDMSPQEARDRGPSRAELAEVGDRGERNSRQEESHVDR